MATTIITNNQKNIRFGLFPINKDKYGLKLDRKIPSSEFLKGPGRKRPSSLSFRSFSNMFWKTAQVDINLSAFVNEGVGGFGLTSVPANIFEAINSVQDLSDCFAYIDSIRAQSQPLNTTSTRINKYTIYLKENYENLNKTSIILNERVFIKDTFKVDKTVPSKSKYIETTLLNFNDQRIFRESFGSEKLSVNLTNNHMVGGGPYFVSSFSSINKTQLQAFLKKIKKELNDQLESLENNPSLDKRLIALRSKDIDNYVNNLEKSLNKFSLSKVTCDYSDFDISANWKAQDYYLGSPDSILASNIKNRKSFSSFWPVLTANIGLASTYNNLGDLVGSMGFPGSFAPFFSERFGRYECFFPSIDNYSSVDGQVTSLYEEYYPPTTVYGKNTIIAGDKKES